VEGRSGPGDIIDVFNSMPLYEYACARCDRSFEKYARTFNETPECPGCGGSDVSRLLSTFAVSAGGGSSQAPSTSGCGEGPPCGASHCGRLGN
jgi:putative FmdB family regulatory protein